MERCDYGASKSWVLLGVVNEPCFRNDAAAVAFHPSEPVLATLGERDSVVRIWDCDLDDLMTSTPAISSTQYTNAKVVVVGESSTGKTCLARALMDEPFEPQESTHGMQVWSYYSELVDRSDGGQIIRETMLWDLAGQVDYQIVNQLFLDETVLGVVMIDSTHPDDPFRGVGRLGQRLKSRGGWGLSTAISGRTRGSRAPCRN